MLLVTPLIVEASDCATDGKPCLSKDRERTEGKLNHGYSKARTAGRGVRLQIIQMLRQSRKSVADERSVMQPKQVAAPPKAKLRRRKYEKHIKLAFGHEYHGSGSACRASEAISENDDMGQLIVKGYQQFTMCSVQASRLAANQ